MWTQSFVIVLFALGFFSVLSDAQYSYYVSASRGDDSNPGTDSQPLKTVQHLIENIDFFNGTTTIYIEEGNYSVIYNSPISRAAITFISSTTPATFTNFNLNIGGTSSSLIFSNIYFYNYVFIQTGRDSTIKITQCSFYSSEVTLNTAQLTVNGAGGKTYFSYSRNIAFQNLEFLDLSDTDFVNNTGSTAGALTLMYTATGPQSSFRNVNFVYNRVVNNNPPAILIDSSVPNSINFTGVGFKCNYRFVNGEITYPPPVSVVTSINIVVVSATNGECPIACSSGSTPSPSNLFKCVPTQVISCRPGQYYDNGSCLSCKAGTYNNINGSTSCIPCTPPTVQPNESSTECIPCGPGRYYINQTLCGVCPRGTYEQDGVCRSCPYKIFKNSRSGETDCDRWQATGIVIVIAIVLGILSLLCLIITLLLSRGLRLNRKERNYAQMKDRKREQERTNREA
eukprot:TRINITY_DN9283_c0_g1_i1.p1 TRINITY_DN9283_c0_g1~~TRINITY_DN9283_c0_g1_i1.p1  ORF type:complete len:454 (+),score=44.63 TRINITY_DN9283_c0_g1_i1:67-1428(+)